MTVTIHLTPDLEIRFKDRAARNGESIAGFLLKLVKGEVLTGDGNQILEPQLGRPLAEIVAPIHEEFRGSGMSEEELLELIEECREEVCRENPALE